MQNTNTEKKLLHFPAELKILIVFHLLINIIFFVYLNRQKPILGLIPLITKNVYLIPLYCSIFIRDITSYGFIFYTILHFSLLFTIVVSVYFIIKSIGILLNLKDYRLLFSCGFSVLFSFIYFLLIYNTITSTLFDSFVYKWNIKYLCIMTTKICRLINFNLLYLFIICFCSILFFTVLNFFVFSRCYFCYAQTKKTLTYSPLFYFSTKIQHNPLILVGITLILVNIAWAESGQLAEKEVFLSWLMDEPNWNFSTAIYSNSGEISFTEKPTSKFSLEQIKYLSKANSSYRSLAGKDFPNIIILVSDSIRSDHLGFNGYSRPTTPFLDFLYYSNKIESAHWATSTCSETMCGIGSILLSRTYDNMKNNGIRLHKILQSIGYNLHFYSSDIPNYKGLYFLYNIDHDRIYNCNTTKKFSTFDDHIILEGLSQLQPSDGTPHFFFFHIMSTHVLGKRFDNFSHYTPSKCICPPSFTSHDQSVIDADRNCYDNGVEQADYIIKNVYNTLQRNGYLKNSIFVILGDHGEGLGERGYFNHTNYLYQEFINIPLIFIRTNRAKRLYLDYATQIDLAPTLLDLIGITPPESWEGKPLTSYYESRVTLHQTTFQNPIRANIVYDNGNIIKYMENNNKCQAYNLNLDPHENAPSEIDCNLMCKN